MKQRCAILAPNQDGVASVVMSMSAALIECRDGGKGIRNTPDIASIRRTGRPIIGPEL